MVQMLLVSKEGPLCSAHQLQCMPRQREVYIITTNGCASIWNSGTTLSNCYQRSDLPWFSDTLCLLCVCRQKQDSAHIEVCNLPSKSRNAFSVFYVSAHDVLSAHPLLRPKVMWKGIYIYSIRPPSPPVMSSVAYNCPRLLRQSNLDLSVLGGSRIPRTIPGPSLHIPFNKLPMLPGGSLGYPAIPRTSWDPPFKSLSHSCLEDPLDIPWSSLQVPLTQLSGILRTSWDPPCPAHTTAPCCLVASFPGVVLQATESWAGPGNEATVRRIPWTSRDPLDCLDTCRQHRTSLHPLPRDCSLYWKRRQQASDKFFTCRWLWE